ncbi:RNA 2',3'-cyclic phosphodiesterase [Exiguobacterium acetylicum]|uniref:RNA 2',3'-cyclic phosphodiesterase n=1 Tax=Exiguobacterium sp. BMC-KP TaxID=1684312 RepID=UPI0006AA3456|nr:RNA 2',3'-cyclic phosphodiesterase [Exiguobacterium sp. BMC-KP]KOP30011.1 hypothetical protein ADM98_14325 [Exiguobacterium sp. BMC-KP]
MRQERHFFVALPIPSGELAKLAGQLSLADYFRNVYTQEEYHLTLRFFGALEEKERHSWEQQLQKIARTVEPFVLRFDRLVAFGRDERPRVVGFGTEAKELFQLVDQIDPHVTKPFVPHVTIAKKWRAEADAWTTSPIQLVEWTVRELVLFEVRPDVSPRYEPVYRIRLGKEE